MFEKEAEEYANVPVERKNNDFVVYKIKVGEKSWILAIEPKEGLSCSDWIKMYEGSEEACYKFVDWLKGAEYGYNKGKEEAKEILKLIAESETYFDILEAKNKAIDFLKDIK